MQSLHEGGSTQLGSRPQLDQVSRKMSLGQIAECLAQHGVEDMTDQLDFQRHSHRPFANGGFGFVYKGKLRDGRSVAIKCIDTQDCALELKGARSKHAAHELYTWSKCDHPGVLKVLGFAISEDSMLLVSPWMQNGSLTRYLGHNGACNKLQLCVDLANTVAYLHEKGIVHGDIKMDNIVVSNDGSIQLVDFGSAALVNYFTLRFTCTSPHHSWSVRFAAPEILLEVITMHTTKSDIYSLGMTILQILTGELPYADKSDVGVIVLLAKAVEKLPLPRSTTGGILRNQCADDKLWELLLRCWNHDPNLRPTAMEVKQVLVGIKRVSDTF